MGRQNLLNMLDVYHPTYSEEIEFKSRMIEFINNHENCFERSLTIGHITASSWLLNHDKTKALMMHHRKLDKWFQLGGHCDGDSDVLAVATREAQEESGLKAIVPVITEIFDIDIHLIPENAREEAHYHYDVRFLLWVEHDEAIIQNKESKELRWVGAAMEELPTNNISVVRMFNKWCNMAYK